MVAENMVRTYGVDQVFVAFGYIEKVVKSDFFFKPLFPFGCAQQVLSYHLISVPCIPHNGGVRIEKGRTAAALFSLLKQTFLSTGPEKCIENYSSLYHAAPWCF